MRRQYVRADVFTRDPSDGTEVVVVLDAEGLSTRQMHLIANEFVPLTTAFVLDPKFTDANARIRIFTNGYEVPFAASPVIAVGYVLATQMQGFGVRLLEQSRIEVQGRAIPLRVLRENENVSGAEILISERLGSFYGLSPECAASCLGLDSSDIKLSRHSPLISWSGSPRLIVELHNERSLTSCQLNQLALSNVLPSIQPVSLYIYTAEGMHQEFTSLSMRIGRGTVLEQAVDLRSKVAFGNSEVVVAFRGRCQEIADGTFTMIGANDV